MRFVVRSRTSPIKPPFTTLFRFPVPVLSLFLLAGATGCGDKKPNSTGDACDEHTPLASLPVQPVRPLVGRVTVRDRYDRHIDPETGAISSDLGLIQGSFFDVSAQTSTAAQFIEFAEVDGSAGSCVGRVSKAQISGEKRDLVLDGLSVNVGGTAGTITLTPTREDSPGIFVYSGALLVRADATIAVSGSGTSSSDFPAFDGSLQGVEPMSVVQPDPVRADLFQLGDFTVAWTGGNGELVEIVIDPVDAPSAVESGGQVVCLVPDDGCYVVPASATEFLLASGATTFNVSVERQRHLDLLPSEDAYVGIEVASQMVVTVKTGVQGAGGS